MATYQHISHGFDPVFDERSRVLVLGSFPSVLSRRNEFYYGNPQNRFWRVMARVLHAPVPPNEGEAQDGLGGGFALEESIEAKKRLLLDGGIALWDAIEECDIKGSSDASIKNVMPAHVERIFERANIDAVVCNGATAGRLYKRFLQWKCGLDAHVLPSTSPANAAWDLARLAARWEEEFAIIGRELAAADEKRAGSEGARKSAAHRAANDSARGEGKPAGSGGAGDSAPGATARGKNTAGPNVSYAVARTAPPASSYAVHKSMQGNKRQDTKPELLVRERLREAGLGGYRLQWKVPGRPDVAWPGKKVCLFINGCFWHRCPRCNPSAPKKNVEYWTAKFTRNVERDRENETALREMGWRVHTIWECELKKKTREDTFARLLPQLSRELGKPLAAPDEGEGGDAQAEGDVAAQAGGNNPAGKKRPAPEESATVTEHGSDKAGAPSPEHHFMYVIECADGTLYTGYTPNVEARFAAHQAGTGAKYTRGRGPLTLVAYAEFSTKHDAMSAEYRFKKLSRPRKDALLAQAAKAGGSFAEILKQELSI